jgi:hypothetical protein
VVRQQTLDGSWGWGKRSGGRKPNHPRFDVRTALYYVVGIDLTEIERIEEMTALTIISEIGVEMSQFATVQHFCSWLGLCPLLMKTGGRVKSSGTRPGVNRAAVAFHQMDHALDGSVWPCNGAPARSVNSFVAALSRNRESGSGSGVEGNRFCPGLPPPESGLYPANAAKPCEKRGINAAFGEQSGTSQGCKSLCSVSATNNQLPEWNSNWRQRG